MARFSDLVRCTSRVAVFGCILLGVAVQFSVAQSERRYVLGNETSFEVKATPSLERHGRTAGRIGLNWGRAARVTLHAGQDIKTGVRWASGPQADTSSANLLAPIGMGLGLGAVGFYAGGIIGVGVASTGDCDTFGCGLGYPILAAIVGESVGLSSGVYGGTRRRGSYLRTLLAGGVGAAVAMTLTNWTESPRALLAGPVLQLALTVPAARSHR